MAKQGGEVTLYERMKLKGVNFDWYERTKAKRGESLGGGKIAPLDNKQCSKDSIYLWIKNGELWSINLVGEKHRVVRPASEKKPEQNTYICACCKKPFKDLDTANTHFVC